MLFEQYIETSPSLGGLVLFGNCGDESVQNPCIPLPKSQIGEKDLYFDMEQKDSHLESIFNLGSPLYLHAKHSSINR